MKVIKDNKEEIFRVNKQDYFGRWHLNCNLKDEKELVLQRGSASEGEKQHISGAQYIFADELVNDWGILKWIPL